jgi:predicted MPP superfamily phosphohydrolase
VLAGHTHGGQIALPVGRRGINLARVMTPLTRGAYQHESSILYVNRGIGVGGPAVRIHCNREIACSSSSRRDRSGGLRASR